MSDQGDAGQWRPATNQNDQHSAPEETTGPLPAISGDEADAPGFPSVSEPPRRPWSVDDDDDAPTGGFPAVSSDPGEEPPAPPERSVFDPVDRADASFGSSEADPGPNGTTPRFGTDVPDPEPEEPSFGSSSSFGSSGSGSFGSSSSYGSGSFGESSYDSGERASSYGSFRDSSFGSGGFDDKRGFDDKPYEPQESSYRPGSFSSESEEKGGSSSTGAFATPPPPPAPDKGVTSEAQAEENEFFASDDHPPMWDKVVAPAGPPPKPGKPSSGNLRLPEWMRDEHNAEAGAAGGPPGGRSGDQYHEEGRSKRPLYLGVGLLLAGLVAVAGVYLMKGKDDGQASDVPTKPSRTSSSSATQPAKVPQTPVKALPKFKGVHTKAIGRVTDARAGLSYARFNRPWALPQKKSPMTELGFNTSQFAVTEKAGAAPKYWARLMSTQLAGAAKAAYDGPGTERAAATEVVKMYEERMFNFRNKKRVLASQPLTVDGHKGWLVSDYVTYRRPGTKATGDVVALALVNTGKAAPGVLFVTVPNTSKKLWPDINFVVRSLRVS